ncbi:MAG: helix-turn-helix transcriptional regulator [Clostridia bacterium]|nr:helix-turn-helix transcriptional regulator [Clostridia bacterium]
MRCVFRDDRQPDGFEEHFDFSPQMPYTITIKRFHEPDIVPLHYAQTVEILLCDGLCGQLTIDNREYSLGGQQLFVIPPYTVHANQIAPCPGEMHVLKVSLTELQPYLNLVNYLELCGCQLHQLAYQCPQSGEAAHIIAQLVSRDGCLPACLPLILELFALLARHTDPQRAAPFQGARPRETGLQELISWTQTHYAQHISLNDAARVSGYSKYHFCCRFKALTGMTYLGYLNQVRISHACLNLKNGQPVQKAARESGFESISYFTKVFRRSTGVTPAQYAQQHRRTY